MGSVISVFERYETFSKIHRLHHLFELTAVALGRTPRSAVALEDGTTLREIDEAEFLRSRAQLKGSFLLGMEGSGAHMNAIGKRLLLQKETGKL